MKDIRIVFHYLYVDVQCSNTFVDDKTLYDYYLNKLLSLGSIKIKKIRSFYFIFFLQYSIFLHVDLNFLTSIFFPPLQRTHFNIVWKAVLPEILSIFVWESPCFSFIWRVQISRLVGFFVFVSLSIFYIILLSSHLHDFWGEAGGFYWDNFELRDSSFSCIQYTNKAILHLVSVFDF